MQRITAVLIAIFLCTLGNAGRAADREQSRLFAVIFAVTVDAKGKVSSFRVSKVTDALSGSTAAVNVPVPESYVAAARAKFAAAAEKKPPSPGEANKEFFTYYYFDPRQPTNVDIDPKRGRS